MNKPVFLLALSLTLGAASALAADRAGTPATGASTSTDSERTLARDKRTFCHKDAGNRQGADRETFMRTCLATALSTQEKALVCKNDAAGTKGEAHRKLVNACLMRK